MPRCEGVMPSVTLDPGVFECDARCFFRLPIVKLAEFSLELRGRGAARSVEFESNDVSHYPWAFRWGPLVAVGVR